MNKIGIDFGTSFSSASWVNPDTGKAESIRFNGKQKIPSILYFDDKSSEPLVGENALNICKDCERIASTEEIAKIMSGIFSNLKRNMQKDMSYYLPNGEKYYAYQLIAEILKYIKSEAEDLCFNESSVDSVVITHPVEFESYKQDILCDAAKTAGFKEIELLPEPVAAAMAYMNTKQREKQGVLVYDFGGGTFDVAFVQFDENGNFSVPSLKGDSNCGGENIDRLIYELWDNLAKKEYERGISEKAGHINRPFELTHCVNQKELMSRREADFKYEIFYPLKLKVALSKDDWLKMISPIIDRTVDLTNELLETVVAGGFNVDKVILIGGSSRIPLVREKLKKIFSGKIQSIMDYDVAVAHGAALYSHRDLVIGKDIYCTSCGGKISTSHKYCWHKGCKNLSYDKRFENI